VKRVLLLGGYGGFGGRIARRVAEAGWEVLVAGRSLDRAKAFCRGKEGMRAVPAGPLPEVLATERPFAVIDAAGPFQSAGYGVAAAAIEAGCHYLDIADGRGFVAGIHALDCAARARGVAVISGGSSVPALSGAVARKLAAGMDEVESVEMAISASIAGSGGASVVRAVLSYAGKPIRLWRGGRWSRGFGWDEMRRQDFTAEGAAPIRGRLVALADVPDLELLPQRLRGTVSVSFRAGTDVALHNVAMWLLARLARRSWFGRLDRFAPLLTRAHRIGRGSDRSGMIVRLFGRKGGRPLERRWTLVAEDGHGPEIPTLAIPILLERLEAQTITPGARDAGETLHLEEFEPAFSGLRVMHEAKELAVTPPLYRRVLGDSFHALPPAVQRMHDVLRDRGATGRGSVTRGRHPIARLVARAMRFPAEGQHALHVHFEARGGVERWTRSFGQHKFSSSLSQLGDLLVERFGLLKFGFRLEGDEDGLRMRISRWWLGPARLPLFLAPRSDAREWEEQGRFWFDVPISLPAVGMVVHYRGWLEQPDPNHVNS